jgi:hypothetical protein
VSTSTPSRRLRLGPVPEVESVKLTITMSGALRVELDRYAALHSQAFGKPVDAATLIPHMLAAFMERDRGFKALRRSSQLLSTES